MSVVCRFQVESTKEKLKELEQPSALGEFRTKKELLNNALTLLKWAVRQRLNNRTIAAVGEDCSQRELEMPYLEAVAEAAAKKQNSIPAGALEAASAGLRKGQPLDRLPFGASVVAEL